MSDVITGREGRTRCAWAGTNDTPLVRYHDKVWGTRTYDESTLFEALTTGRLPGRVELGDRVREAGRVSEGVSWLRRRQGRTNDFAGRQSVGRGRVDHSKPRQDRGDPQQRTRDDVRFPDSRRVGEDLQDRPQAPTAVSRRDTYVDSGSRVACQAAEVAGLSL